LAAAGELGYRLPDDDIKLGAARGAKDPRRRLAREFPILRNGHGRQKPSRRWQRAADSLAQLLLEKLRARPLGEEDRALRILLAYSTIALAPDLVVPKDPISRAAWNASVKLFARLFPSGVSEIEPLPCVLRQLPKLRREVVPGLKIGRVASGRTPGPAGRNLAVDRQLIARVGKALGRRFKAGYMGRYLYYTRPGDHIWPHPDDPKFAVTLLICVRHDGPANGADRSAFVAYLPNGSVKRFHMTPGSAVALEPGLIHAREPVQPGERVALLSIGLVDSH
jgi:hypothetical protein